VLGYPIRTVIYGSRIDAPDIKIKLAFSGRFSSGKVKVKRFSKVRDNLFSRQLYINPTIKSLPSAKISRGEANEWYKIESNITSDLFLKLQI